MRNLLLFFLMTIFVYIYSYIIGGETSMIMVYMFLLSPIVSFLLVFPSRKRIEVSIDVPSSEVEKGGVTKVKVHLKNRTFIPIPFVNVIFCQAQNFSVDGSNEVMVSLGAFQNKTITLEYTAKSRGIGEIGVIDIRLKDYLNLFSLSLLGDSVENRYRGEVTVLPRLQELKPTSKILLASPDALQQDDSGIATIGLYSWNGEPGYEFREYMAGDPLHKVHWKLSARSEKLMVRKDEGRGVSKKRLILDPFIYLPRKEQNGKTLFKYIVNSSNRSDKRGNYTSYDEILMLEEKTLEAMLAVAHMSVRTGREVELWLYENNNWNRYALLDSKSVNEIQHRLASFIFSKDITMDFTKRLPLEDILEYEGRSRYSGGGESTVFTGYYDEALQKAIDSFTNYGMVVDTVSIKASLLNSVAGAKELEKALSNRQGNTWVLGLNDDLNEALS